MSLKPRPHAHHLFTDSAKVIDSSGVAAAIEARRRPMLSTRTDPGSLSGHTLLAFLTSALVLLRSGITASTKRIVEYLRDLSTSERTAVGLQWSDEDVEKMYTTSGINWAYGGLARALAAWFDPLDPYIAFPSRRNTNAAHRHRLASLSPTDKAQMAERQNVVDEIVNDLLAASVREPRPRAYRGDVVIDETEIEVAGLGEIGFRDDLNRSALPIAGPVVRSRAATDDAPTAKRKDPYFGIGVTAMSQVGPPGAARSLTPLFISAAVRPPNSGSVDATRVCFDQARRTDRLPPVRGGKAAPTFTADRGYSDKNGLAELLVEHKFLLRAVYSARQRYTNPHFDSIDGRKPDGVIFSGGCYFCPLAKELLSRSLVLHDWANCSPAELEKHDQRLARLTPLRMPANSGITSTRARRGRPTKGAPDDRVHSIEVMCPAVAGLVGCSLKPESLNNHDLPHFEPDWQAKDYRCCSSSFTTIKLDTWELKRYQHGTLPYSWKHLAEFSTHRSLTEGLFSQVKSMHMAGFTSVSGLSKNSALVSVLAGLSLVATNLHMQAHPTHQDVDASADRLKSLERLLGHPLH